MMMKMSLWLLLLGFVVTFTAAAGPGSCVGRCGEIFTRGKQCTCDLNCLQYNECCKDFQATCTPVLSCQGRCGETFRRGRMCECDPQCVRYNTCCHDYQMQCDASALASHLRSVQPLRAIVAGNRKAKKNKKKSSESEEWSTGGLGPLNPLSASSGPTPPSILTNPLQYGMSNTYSPFGQLPTSISSSYSGAPDSPAFGSSLPSRGALSWGLGAPVSPSGPGAVNVHQVPLHGEVTLSGTSQDLSGPAGSMPRASTLQDIAQALGPSAVEGGTEGPGAGLFVDVDLCSDSLINGLTALINGSILIFKGELFWLVDPVSRSASRPQSITDTLGISSPIDTVFTRSNCHGQTYIIKGDQYWRLDRNMMMEPGFPKPLASEFPGLMGPITAALAVPATKNKPETIFFFKNGDIMQKFTFPSGSTPPCNQKAKSSQRGHRAAVGLLSAKINLKVSLKGFPTPVTSALSMPSPQRSDVYHHYVFSGPLFFRIQISGDLPVLAKPDPSAVFAPLPILRPIAAATDTANMAPQNADPPQPANSIRVWLQCP
ncbi:proteoglycan 4a [Thunnus maccoyii]|uniref:proteoglycan 4a n=1 Tax=Thunnus maccoyii TaxID=8240 RepID=UPI001C4CF933|nr:proteoglycan 4a [Thunnus maccoyii]